MKEVNISPSSSREGSRFGQRFRKGIYGLGVISTLVPAINLHIGEAAAQSEASAPQAVMPAGFVDEKVPIAGLDNPTVIAFSPDWTMFIGEKKGRIKAVRVNTDIPILVADFNSNVYSGEDRGFLGMAVDKKFNTGRSYVYGLFTRDSPPGENTPYWNDSCPDNTKGCVVTGELDKFTINLTTLKATRRTPLISGEWEQQFSSHSIGAVEATDDNALIVCAGDGAGYTDADYGQYNLYAMPRPIEGDPPYEGGALRSQDQRTPGDPTTLSGTISRVHPDTGEPLQDNPNYVSGLNKNAKRIAADGFRNPFRCTIKPGTDQVWIADVGYRSFEEINVVNPLATGNNFGWPCYEGAGVQPEYQALNLQICDTLYRTNAVKSPYYAESHDGVASSFSGITFYDGDKYPQEYKGALFFANYSKNEIKAMKSGEDGLPNPNDMHVFPAQHPVDLKLGPDGNLYYVELNYKNPSESSIHRIRYAGLANNPPYAKIDSDKYFGRLPLTVRYRSRSTDQDGDPLTCKWDLDGDGLFERGSCDEQAIVYGVDMDRNIKASLEVTDPKGARNAASKTIFAGDTPPRAVLTFPPTDSIYDIGTSIDFGGFVEDDESPPAEIKSSVTAQLQHCEDVNNPQTCQVHILQEQTGLNGSVIMPNHGDPQKYRLELFGKATDLRGLADPDPAHAIIYPR